MIIPATSAMTDDTLLPFAFPAVQGKKVTAAFDGGRITSDAGVMMLAAAERKLGIAAKLAAVICDRRDPSRVIHQLPDILRARMFAIGCGYEDGDDLDWLRFDPAFKLACGRLPASGHDLCSQPTVSRWENAPTLRISSSRCSTLIMTSAAFCRSISTTPRSRGRWRCCCALARRPRGGRSPAICAGWSGAFGGTGRQQSSRSAATAIMDVRKSWISATKTALILCS